jgi:hypothetical protein
MHVESNTALGRHHSIPSQWQSITTQLQNIKIPLKNKTRTAHPIPPHRQCGWLSRYTTYTTHPSNPDLDDVPTGAFEITSYPTSLDSVLLHAPDGKLISPILKARLHQLTNMFHPQETTATFQEALVDVSLRHDATTYKETYIN